MKNVFEKTGAMIEFSAEGRPSVGVAALSILISVATILPCSNASAETDEECAAVGRIAERVMEGRQNGNSLQSTLDVLIPKNKEEADSGFRRMIMEAYEAPNFHTQDGKDRAIGEFRDQWQLKCMKGTG